VALYGESKYSDLVKDNLIDIKEDGSFQLDTNYINYYTGLMMTTQAVQAILNPSILT